jgi:A/G-specific adenine glycosylase
MKGAKKTYFTRLLMDWNKTANGRKMPWKGEKNPYRIWLSEIILQQTRVEQGWNYYNRFIENYPTVHQLAAAPDTAVFKLWEGLGYYSRCKNVLATARHISAALNGKFPDTYEEILSLKGVGPYTAAAISSFAFDLPHAVVDGNVYRLLSRYFGLKVPVDSPDGKKLFAALAGDLLEKKAPGLYNQAIMDFGATVCKPLPLCGVCPLRKNCVAFQQNETGNYPVKGKKLLRTTRWFYYLALEYHDRLLIRTRLGKDIWQNLHELVLFESDHELTMEEITTSPLYIKMINQSRLLDISQMYVQQLTHQTIKGKIIHLQLSKEPQLAGYRLEEKPALLKLAFPKFLTAWLADSRILF